VARIVTAAAHVGNRFGYKRRQGARHLSFPEVADGGRLRPLSALLIVSNQRYRMTVVEAD
jgi:hypothetical protein